MAMKETVFPLVCYFLA